MGRRSVALIVAGVLAEPITKIVAGAGEQYELTTAAALDLNVEHPGLWLVGGAEAETLAKRIGRRPAAAERLLVVLHHGTTRRLDEATRRYARRLGADQIVLLPAGAAQIRDEIAYATREGFN